VRKWRNLSLKINDGRYGTPPLLVKGSRDPSVRSERHADSRCGIVTVGLTRSALHTVSYPTWSGVFNKLKFDHLLKKKKKFFYLMQRTQRTHVWCNWRRRRKNSRHHVRTERNNEIKSKITQQTQATQRLKRGVDPCVARVGWKLNLSVASGQYTRHSLFCQLLLRFRRRMAASWPGRCLEEICSTSTSKTRTRFDTKNDGHR